MARNLSGAAVLVTGAASGTGRAGALAFAAAGARVAAVDVDARGLATLAEKSDGRIRPMVADVRDADQVENAVANTLAAFGRLDIAHNNAGVPSPMGPFWECTEEDFAAVLAVDLLGVWRWMSFEARQMIGQGGGGCIVNTSTSHAAAGTAGTAAMHGVHGLTRAAAVELARHRVRVNAVAPGITRTAAGVRPEEIADAVLWLAGASYATGAVLTVDGGYTAR
jgi:NAD(P)-dependent dehydrogenase (short-subunit alcohol dehydrogenase family)